MRNLYFVIATKDGSSGGVPRWGDSPEQVITAWQAERPDQIITQIVDSPTHNPNITQGLSTAVHRRCLVQFAQGIIDSQHPNVDEALALVAEIAGKLDRLDEIL